MNLLQSFRSVILLTLACLFCSSCTNQVEKNIVQGSDHWVQLNASDASVSNDTYSWDFQLNRKGKYVIQVLTEGELMSSDIKVIARIDTDKLEQTLGVNYSIGTAESPQTISQFDEVYIFKKNGKYTFKIKTPAAFQSIRIIPHFSNGLGSGKYLEEWSAMHNSPEKVEAMKWFDEAKFGMFIHWGLYSQAGGMWKGTYINDSPYPGPKVAEWLMSTFQISRQEYSELAKTFNPDKSFARNIARLAKDAGMKYMVITSKHHDGFALFDSKCSAYDIVDATPYEGDAIKELYEACLEEGIAFGVYYSHGNDWFDGTDGNFANMKKRNDLLGIYTHRQGKNTWDPSDNTHAEYLENKAYPQVAELMELLPELKLIWFDGEGFITEEQAFRFYKLIYDTNPNIIVSRRVGYDFGDYVDMGDNHIPTASEKLKKSWETCGTTNNSWGYKAFDEDWKSTKELLYWFIDIASKGGNYLLNVGPDGFGNVPEKSAQGLREMGEWLSVNGEAIYGTTRWKVLNEGQGESVLGGTGHRAEKGFTRYFTTEDFWFTAKENKVYAISLVAADGDVQILTLNNTAGPITSVRLLGCDKKIVWKQTNSALEVNLSGIETSDNGFAIEVVF